MSLTQKSRFFRGFLRGLTLANRRYRPLSHLSKSCVGPNGPPEHKGRKRGQGTLLLTLAPLPTIMSPCHAAHATLWAATVTTSLIAVTVGARSSAWPATSPHSASS